MIFIELLSELSYVFQFHQKRKRGRKKKNPSKEYFELGPISNSSNGSTNHSFTTVQKLSKSSPNQYQDTCVVSHFRIEASARSNFLETKIYNFPHTHIHAHTTPKSAHATKKLPSCRGQLLRPFHSPPSFYFTPWLRFTPSHAPSFSFLIASQSRTNDFYRVSSIF